MVSNMGKGRQLRLTARTVDTLLFYKQIQADIETQFGLQQVFEIREIVSIKNLQFVLFCSPLRKWEQHVFERTANLPIIQYKHYYEEVLCRYAIPRVEDYYKATIVSYYLFAPHIHNNTAYTFSVKQFATPIFKADKANQRIVEEAALNKLSRCLRMLNGRGPDRLTVAMPDNRLALFIIDGIIGSFIKEYGSENAEVRPHIEELFILMVKQAVESFYKDEFDSIPELFSSIDLSNNRILIMAVIDPIACLI